MKTPPIPDTTVDTELDQIIFDFWLNATSSTSGNPYQTAKDQATKAIKQLLTTEINKAEQLGTHYGYLKCQNDFIQFGKEYTDKELAEQEDRLKHLGSLLEGKDE